MRALITDPKVAQTLSWEVPIADESARQLWFTQLGLAKAAPRDPKVQLAIGAAGAAVPIAKAYRAYTAGQAAVAVAASGVTQVAASGLALSLAEIAAVANPAVILFSAAWVGLHQTCTYVKAAEREGLLQDLLLVGGKVVYTSVLNFAHIKNERVVQPVMLEQYHYVVSLPSLLGGLPEERRIPLASSVTPLLLGKDALTISDH
jgi:hypothetical protein